MGIRPRLALSGGGRLAALSPRRRKFLLFAAGVVAAAVIAAAAPPLINALASSDPAGYPAQDRPGTVLLVPGYGGGTSSFATLAQRLRAAGRTVVVVQFPDSGTGDLAVEADTLDSYVNDALRSSPSVDVVGYSAGGVVARLWTEDHGGAAKARRVVTFGSPYNGTTLASAGAGFSSDLCPVACQELVPGSSLLTRMNQSALGGHPPWLSLWTTLDTTVTPPTSADLPGAIDVPLQSVCADDQASHGGLPTDPLVIGIVLRALGDSTLTAPTASQCSALRASGSS